MADRNPLRRALDWLQRDDRVTRGADPTLPWGSSYIPTNGQTGLVRSGFTINEDNALTIASVYTAVAILADSVATLPVAAYRRGKREAGPVDNPPQLITDPWPEGTMQDWLSQVMVSLTLRGNFFGQIVDRDPQGFATMVMPIHPDAVMARRMQDGTRAYWVSGKRVQTKDIVHIPNLLVPGSFVGLNPVEYMAQSWGLAGAAEKYMGQFYANSATPTGVVETPEDLSEEETLELARSWKMSHGGLAGAGYPAVLTGGATFRALTVSPGDAQFLQTRDFQRQDIASFFRIPSHLMGQQDRTSSWGTGVEQMEIGYVINTLRPYLNKIEAYLTRLTPPRYEVLFDLSDRLRGDTTQRYANYAVAINNGFMNLDEPRILEGMPPLPNGDGQHFMRPLNFAPIDKILDGSIVPGGGGTGGGTPQGVDDTPPPQSGPDKGPNGQAAAEADLEYRAALLALASRQHVVNVGSPEVHVAAPEVRNEITMPAAEPPVVHNHVEAAAAPNVTVENRVDPTPIQVDVAAPTVNVRAPNVRVDAPDVTVTPTIAVDLPNRRTVTEVERGRDGLIRKTTSTETDA